MTTSQTITKYGKPNVTGKGYLTVIDLPYPMRLAWDLDTIVTKVSCHKLIAEPLLNVFNQLLLQYTLEGLQMLEIDIYGGCFNYRKMRNGNSWSKHSWGIAIDLNPEKNGLKTPYEKALFSEFVYEPMMDIFYHNGFINLGKEIGRDAMHFQIKE